METLLNFIIAEVMDIISNLFQNNMVDFFVQSDYQQGLTDVAQNIKISPVVNEHVLELNDHLTKTSIQWASKLTRLGRVLGAIFAIIVAGKEAYKMMAEQKGLDVLAIMRPIGFAFILAFWNPVVNTVIAPGLAIESSMRGLYVDIETQMEDLRRERYVKAKEFKDNLYAKLATSEKAKSERDWWDLWGQLVDAAKDAKDNFINFFKGTIVIMETSIMEFIDRLVIWIGETCFTVGAYIVFVIKGLYLTVLAMFGPIWMAASILPAWKDAWRQWLEKIVHASLYGAMAYLVMSFSMQLIVHNLELDVQTITALCDSQASILEYDLGGIGTSITTVITYFVGMIALSAVPDLASCAFPGAGSMAVQHFIGGMKQQAYSKTMGAAKMVISKGK